ncbi:MAG TPA: hypothetical protein VGP96_16120, partial [Candidatus Dormibacteraeota bacterium]|nr:hypothetical protein [Candidatus Dormibacteraeota bacterium]
VGNTRRDEAWHLAWVIADLRRLEAGGQLGAEGQALLRRYREWYAWLAGPAPAAPPVHAGTAGAPPPPPSGVPVGAPPPPPAAPPSWATPARPAYAPAPSPGLDLRRLISTHGVLLLSWAGALLLVSATVLFLAYGPEGLGGGARAATVLGLNAALLAVAVVCHHRAALRLVEQTYLALTALTLPLSLAAMYGYVIRDATGMTSSTAVALGGALCAVVYERIASLLRSTAYAALCLGMATTAAVSAAIAAGAGARALPGVALIALAGWLLAERTGSPFAPPGRWLALAATLAGPWAAVASASHQVLDGATAPRALQLPLTLAATAAVCLYPALRRGRALLGWASVLLASATPLALAWSLGAGGGELDLTLALTALGTAAVTALPWRLLDRAAFGTRVTLTLGDAVALLAGLEAVAAAARSSRLDVELVAVAAATLAGTRPALRRSGESALAWLVLGPVVVAAVAAGALDRGGNVLPEHWPAGVPCGLALVLAATALVAVRRRSSTLLPWLSAGLTVAALTAVSAWQLGQAGYSASLVILGTALAAMSVAMPPAQRPLAWWGAGLRLAGAACVIVSPVWLEALLSTGALAGAVLLAAMTRRALAGLLVTALGAAAWYWAAALVAGGALTLHQAAIALAPLPFLAAAGLALTGPSLRRAGGDLAVGLWAGTGGLVVLSLGLCVAAGDHTLLSAVSGALAVAVYLAGRRLQRLETVVGAAALAAISTVNAAVAIGFGTTGAVLGLTALGLIVRGAALLDGPRPHWRTAHRLTALGLAALAVLWAFPEATGTPDGLAGLSTSLALAGFAATLVAAALLATEPAGPAPRLALWGGVLLAATALDWLSAAAHLQDAQDYVVAPALAAICCGLAARGDRLPDGRPGATLPLLGGGLLLLLGSSGLQALAASSGSWYLPLLLGEAIAVLLVGVIAESRLCAVAAGGALAGVCLRALGIAAASLPLYAVFGGCALLLLTGSLGLALERERVNRLRQALSRWRP